MVESLPLAVRGRWRQGARFVVRTGRRALVESLYLLTAPVIAAVGLLLVLGGLCVATAGLLRPGKSRPAAGALTPARWFADLERWRIATVRSLAAQPQDAGGRPRPEEITASDPGLWLDAAHTVVVLPVALVTAVVTALWWFAALAGAAVG
jgi:Putative sensor